MRLLGSLYTIESAGLTEQGCDYAILLDPEHFIYKAHFPGEPITPGVCIMQIAIELLGEYLGSPLSLNCAKNVKYLKTIEPDKVTRLCYSLQKVTVVTPDATADSDTYSGAEAPALVKAQVVVSAGDTVYTKLSLECKK